VQTKIFKISYNIISKVVRNDMLEELRLGAFSHFYSAKLHVGNDQMHFTSGILYTLT
jgi:hypothetical protein